jgi:DNA-binding MarR family transcriptional regulator
MKSLEIESISMTPPDAADLIMETMQLVMATLRAEMRQHRPAELTVPQFRAVFYLKDHPGASLSEVSETLGLMLSSTSKLIDGLVKRDFLRREMAVNDRRRAILTLTARGESALAETARQAHELMAVLLANLTDEEHATVGTAMQTLRRVFTAHCAGKHGGRGGTTTCPS